MAGALASPLAFLDDDAAAAPDWLKRLIAPYDDNKVGAVGTRRNYQCCSLLFADGLAAAADVSCEVRAQAPVPPGACPVTRMTAEPGCAAAHDRPAPAPLTATPRALWPDPEPGAPGAAVIFESFSGR